MRFCIWHIPAKRVAVNLGGHQLKGLTREEAVQIMEWIHPSVRDLVEIRPHSEAHVPSVLN